MDNKYADSTHLLLEDGEELVVVDEVGLWVLHPDPEGLHCVAVVLVHPLKVSLYVQLHP